jgi:hypothetical protein
MRERPAIPVTLLAAPLAALTALTALALALAPATARAEGPRPGPWALTLDLGFAEFGTRRIPVQPRSGDADWINAEGGGRLALGARFLRLDGGRYETRAAVATKVGPWSSIIFESDALDWRSALVEVTEDVALGDWCLGAGLRLPLGVAITGRDYVKTRWRASPGFTTHLERQWRGGMGGYALGARLDSERLTPATGAAVDLLVIGVYLMVTWEPAWGSPFAGP